MNNCVRILKIEWMDNDNPEAEVYFEINNRKFWAFCHPCKFVVNDTVKVRFEYIEEEVPQNVFWNENYDCKKEIISIKNNRWSYSCNGQIISNSPVEIDCGSIIFNYYDLKIDENKIGSYVYFVISRLDINSLDS